MTMDKKKSTDDEFLKFVHLVGDNKIILSKSQTHAVKIQKHEAIAEMIIKWADVSGQKLTEQSLLKKLHNMKTRTNEAAKKSNLSGWQSKLRELNVGFKISFIHQRIHKVLIIIDHKYRALMTRQTVINCRYQMIMRVPLQPIRAVCSKSSIPIKRKAEDILNKLETDEKKDLSNDDLQRYLLLKQVKLVNLQIEKLEKPTVDVQFVEWTQEELNYVDGDTNL